jgi:hypothetical protein
MFMRYLLQIRKRNALRGNNERLSSVFSETKRNGWVLKVPKHVRQQECVTKGIWNKLYQMVALNFYVDTGEICFKVATVIAIMQI